jgi:hypothetical protein
MDETLYDQVLKPSFRTWLLFYELLEESEVETINLDEHIVSIPAVVSSDKDVAKHRLWLEIIKVSLQKIIMKLLQLVFSRILLHSSRFYECK